MKRAGGTVHHQVVQRMNQRVDLDPGVREEFAVDETRVSPSVVDSARKIIKAVAGEVFQMKARSITSLDQDAALIEVMPTVMTRRDLESKCQH
jgi:hypothetical protein